MHRDARRTLTRLVVAVAVALVVAGCGDDDGSGGAGGDVAVEGDHVVTSVTEGGEPHPLVAGTTVRLRLDDGSLTARAGCNTIGGTYRFEERVLRVDAVSMTEMGCDAALHDQDEWLADVLSSGPTIEPTADGFVLRADAIELTFVERSVVEPDAALVGTTWVVDGYVDGAGPDAGVSSTSGERATVVFGVDGFVTGDDGCNELGSAGEAGEPPTHGLRYVVEGDEITFSGRAVTTDVACPGVDTDRFWAVLSGTVHWEVEASRLTMRAGDGRGVIFTTAS